MRVSKLVFRLLTFCRFSFLVLFAKFEFVSLSFSLFCRKQRRFPRKSLKLWRYRGLLGRMLLAIYRFVVDS